METSAQNPVRPHFVECPGVPVLDQGTCDQFPIQIKTPPVSDDEEDYNKRSDVENVCDDVSSEKTHEDDDDDSDMNDDLYLGGVNYHSLPHSTASKVVNDVPNGVSSDAPPQIIKEDFVNTEKTVLVPVRDPETRKIKNMLVPVEVMDETGCNIIKTVLIPVQDEDGTMSYEVKKVTVPLKPETWIAPQMKTEPLTVGTPTRTIEQVVEVKQPKEKKESVVEARKGSDEKPEEKNVAQEPEIVLEPDSPKGEMDLMLEKLRTVCPFCQKSFADEKEMDRHVFRNHKKPYRCKQCYLVYFRKESFEDHMKTHSVDYLECPFCRMRYKSMSGLRNHQIRVHSTIEAKFVCDHCDKRYRLKSDLAVHIDRAHMDVTHVCRFCGKAVKNIVDHENQHRKANKKIDYQFCCHLCSKKFQVRNSLDNHLLMHKSGFKCKHCKEVFDRPTALKKHKQVIHGPSLVCSICDKKFNNRTSLHTHVVVTHAGIRPFKCDICGDNFTQRHCLKKHRSTHPGPLPPLSDKTSIAAIAKKILQKS